MDLSSQYNEHILGLKNSELFSSVAYTYKNVFMRVKNNFANY